MSDKRKEVILAFTYIVHFRIILKTRQLLQLPCSVHFLLKRH